MYTWQAKQERLEGFTNTLEILQNQEHRLETSTYDGPFSVKPSRQQSFPAGGVPWHGSVGQLGRALTRSAVGQDGGMVQAWRGLFCTAPAIIGLGSCYKHLKFNLEKRRCSQEKVKQREGEACWGKYIHIFQTGIFLNLEKISGKIKFTGEQRELRPKMQSSSSNP